MYKNQASQQISFLLIDKATGDGITGESANISARVKIDNAGTADGDGTIYEMEDGVYLYTPTQSETNGNHLTFIFTHTDAITVCLNIYTTDLSVARAANLTQIDGLATSGNNATLNLKKLSIVNSGDKAVYITSSDSDAMQILSTGATGGALNIQSQTVNSALGIQSNNSPVGTSATHAINIQGYGNGIQIGGGVTSGVGNAIGIGGGSISGSGIAISTVNGHGITVIGSGANHAINLTNSGTGRCIFANSTVTPVVFQTSGINAYGMSLIGGTGSNGGGMSISASSAGRGLVIQGGSTANALEVTGGSTSGSCISMSNTSGSQVVISSNTSNNPAVVINGNSGGTSGRAVYLLSPVGGGEAFLAQSLNNSSAFGITAGGAGIGMRIAGTSIGLSINGGSTGAGVRIAGGTTSGNAVNVLTTDGHGIDIDANGSGKFDVNADLNNTIDISGIETDIDEINSKLTSQKINVVNPLVASRSIKIIAGDDYKQADGRAYTWTDTLSAWPDITGATVTFKAVKSPANEQAGDDELVLAGTVVDGSTVYVEMTTEDTASLAGGTIAYDYRLYAELTTGAIVTLSTGTVSVDTSVSNEIEEA